MINTRQHLGGGDEAPGAADTVAGLVHRAHQRLHGGLGHPALHEAAAGVRGFRVILTSAGWVAQSRAPWQGDELNLEEVAIVTGAPNGEEIPHQLGPICIKDDVAIDKIALRGLVEAGAHKGRTRRA